MSKDGEWGGHLELQALTQALGVNFIIHMKGRAAMVLTSMSESLSREEALLRKDSVHLAYHLVEDIAEHYSAVRLKDDDTGEPAREIPLSIFKGVGKLQDYSEEGMHEDEEEWLREQMEWEQGEEKLEQGGGFRKSKKEIEAEEEAELRRRVEEKVVVKQAKNAKCACGSKKTYKDCCLRRQYEEVEKRLRKKKDAEDDEEQNVQQDIIFA